MPRPHHIQNLKSILRGEGALTAAELAARMECSERTIQRCVEHLRDVEKWPIDSGQSGYWLRKPSSAETSVSTPREVAALALAYEALRELGWSELGVQIRAELATACRHHGDLGELRWENLDGIIQQRLPAGAASLDYDIQGRLTLAILQQQVIEIHYRKLEAEDGYAVSVFPHRLIHRDQSWYLIAEDLERGGQRTYAVPRISQVAVQARPEGFEVPTFVDHYQHAFGIWTPYVTDGPLHDVCVELTDYWARIARERQWHPSQQLDDLASDRVRVRFRLSELVEVKSWVLSFGSAAIVIAPRQLREMVIAEFEAGRGNYR